MKNEIYLDNGMTTKPKEEVIASMMTFLTEKWGVPSAPHKKGQELFVAIEKSYSSIYKLLQANENDRFIFTSSGAEAVNQVVSSTYQNVTEATGRNQYICSSIDEAPILMALSRLEETGAVVKMAKPDTLGQIETESIASLITPRTALISLSFGNGMTGVIQDVKEIGALCKERGILFHLEATHILGRHFFERDEVDPDFITFNGDNLHAPKGTGGLLVKEGVRFSPLIYGGLEQAGLRAGHLNVASLVALGEAARLSMEASDFLATEIATLRNKFEEKLIQEIPEITILFKEGNRLPTVSCVSFLGVPSELLLYHLNQKSVYASIGGGSFQQINLLLKESGIAPEIANCAVNFTLSFETTKEEIEEAVLRIADCVKRCRKISLNFK